MVASARRSGHVKRLQSPVELLTALDELSLPWFYSSTVPGERRNHCDPVSLRSMTAARLNVSLLSSAGMIENHSRK
jgi:hypothetical protein